MSQVGPSVVPSISYEDVLSAIAFLERAFGFEEDATQRYADGEGNVNHAELRTPRGGIVYLSNPGPEYHSPKDHAATCEEAARWLALPYNIDGVVVVVDDVDAHCERARANGATILRDPTTEEYGRLYNAADVEGHRWMFMQALS
jgi:PhnB protein